MVPYIKPFVQQQCDTYDCGIYSLIATEKFLKEQTKWKREADWQDMWEESEVVKIRWELFDWYIKRTGDLSRWMHFNNERGPVQENIPEQILE